MNLKEYQEKARSTAIYLDIKNSKIIYPALGLIGECGEVAEKIKKLIRDDGNDLKKDRKLAIAKELGDCCWYLANICCDTDLDLNMMHEMRNSSVVHRMRKFTFPQLIFRMNRQTTAAVELLEFWYYKNECRPNVGNEDVWKICPHLSHIITCIEEIAIRCGFTLEEICITNIKKLLDRKERGILKGEGDDR